jgi:hypothetical protein
VLFLGVRRSITSGLVGCVLAVSNQAFAQDEATRSAARAAGEAGVQAYQDGSYDDAEAKLHQAFVLLQVPTLGYWHARALAKTGKLVEAAERYEAVTKLEVKAGKAATVQQQAQADAAKELAELRPRIPRLTLIAKGSTDGLEVTLDGTAVPNDSLGSERQVNPGAHRVTAKRGERQMQWDITLAEAETASREIDLGATDDIPVAPLPPPAPVETAVNQQPGPVAPNVPIDQPADPSKNQRIAGWIVLGMGGVATVAGVVTGLVVISKKNQLDNSGDCDGTECYPSQRELRESYNSLRIVSGTSLVVGALGLGTGAALLLTTRKPKDRATPSAWIGPGSVGIRGNF